MRDARREYAETGPPGVQEAVPSRRAGRGKGCFLAGLWWHGGVLEGGVAAAMVAGTAALAGLPAHGPLLVLAFCATLLVYHLDRTPALSPEDRCDHPDRWQWRHQHPRSANAVAIAAVAGACAALPHLRLRTVLAGAVLAVPAAAYALPLFGKTGHARRLKDIGGAKPFAVAAAWAGASVLFPWLEAAPGQGGAGLAGAAMPLALLGGYRFLFVLPNVLLADAAGGETASARSLRRLAGGTLGLVIAGGVLGGGVLGATPLLVADLAGPAGLAVALALGWRGRGLVRVADCAMYAPALAATAAAVGALG